MDYQIINRWTLFSRLGHGSFGEVYLGISHETRKEVAVKIVLMKCDKHSYERELRAYDRIKDGVGIPQIAWCGFESEVMNLGILVMEKLGLNLRDLLGKYRKFSLRTVLFLADQMISRLEFIHSKHIIHQDIKPDNFAVGSGSRRHTVYLFDFGLSNVFINSKTSKHVKEESDLGLIGSLKYSSINSQGGNRQSRRDDLESLGYTLITFLKGKLPWGKLKSNEIISRRDRIMQVKASVSIEDLCKDLPVEFKEYMQYCRQLQFQEKPNYEFCKRIFHNLYLESGFKPNCAFEWSSKRK